MRGGARFALIMLGVLCALVAVYYALVLLLLTGVR